MIVYYDHSIEQMSLSTASVFLAGPTNRANVRTPWRVRMIEHLLAKRQIDILVPEFCDGNFHKHARTRFALDYKPVCWEAEAMARAHVLLFWMPLCDDYPGLTTRSEVGAAIERAKYRAGHHAQRLVLGMPAEAESASYIRHHAAQANVRIHETLQRTADAALALIEEE